MMQHFSSMTALAACFWLLPVLHPPHRAAAANVNDARPARKAWWSKALGGHVHSAGRLTETWFKYAFEVGFQHVVVLHRIANSESVGREVRPSTERMTAIARDSSLSRFTALNGSATAAAVSDFVRLVALLNASQSTLLVSDDVRLATFYALLANVERSAAGLGRLQSRAAAHGFDFSGLEFRPVVRHVFGENAVIDKPQTSYGDWYVHAWYVKPVAPNVWTAGQIEWHQLADVKRAGFVTVVNNRKRALTAGKPSQEEVTLLNIRDRTGTYEAGGRQDGLRLLESRLDESKPNSYISDTSRQNFQSQNVQQFGDAIGYNETHESLQFAAAGLEYIAMPIGGEVKYGSGLWQTYGPKVAKFTGKTILYHCRTAYRSSVIALMAHAHSRCLTSSWALQRAALIGFQFGKFDPSVVAIYQETLDNRSASCLPYNVPGLAIRLTSMGVTWTILLLLLMLC